MSHLRVPFELTQGDGGRVVYALNYGGKDVQLTSEQITAALFTKLKEIGENALGTKVFAFENGWQLLGNYCPSDILVFTIITYW